MTTLVAILFLLCVGAVLVAYGTAAKNKWGINLAEVFCPRCGTALPRMHEPRSLRQAIWGGWTCPVCGAGVDKWGREITPSAPRAIAIPEPALRRLIRKRLIVVAPFCFLISLVLDWTGVTNGGFPHTWVEAVGQIIANVVQTGYLATVFYFAWVYLIEHYFLRPPDLHSRNEPGAERNELR